MYIYIYIERERESERYSRYTHIHMLKNGRPPASTWARRWAAAGQRRQRGPEAPVYNIILYYTIVLYYSAILYYTILYYTIRYLG